jgi:hypothetical protein
MFGPDVSFLSTMLTLLEPPAGIRAVRFWQDQAPSKCLQVPAAA